MFLDSFFIMFSMWLLHVIHVSIVTPNSLWQFTCSIFDDPRDRFRTGLWSCCFCLGAIIIDFVLSGWITIEFLLHQSSVLSKLSCNVSFIIEMFLFDVWSDESSAKRVSLVCWFKCSGRSLIYSKKKSGPSTDPWGTPDVVSFFSVVLPFRSV